MPCPSLLFETGEPRSGLGYGFTGADWWWTHRGNVVNQGHKPADLSPVFSELGGSEMTLEVTLVLIYTHLTGTTFLWLQLIWCPLSVLLENWILVVGGRRRSNPC